MGENPMSSEKNISAGKVEKSNLSGGEEATDKKKKKKHSRRWRWKDSIKAEECRVSASGVEAFGSKDVHESHGFVLSGLLPGQQAGEIARTGYIVSMKRWMKAYVTGFTRQQYVRALQTFIAYVIFMCIVSPDAVNSALWYNGIMPPELGLIYVLMISVLGGTVGTNSVMQVYALVSLVVAGLFGVLIRYIVWLASGEDWDNNDFAKGAAFSLLIALSCACFNILRWKWDATNAFFLLCSVFLIFTQGPYYGPQAGTLYLTAVYTLINIAFATMIYTLVSWFVLPMYSCQAMRASTAKAIEGIGSAIMAERDLIMSPVDPESGLFQEATGERDPLTGRDCGLFPKCEKIADVMRASRGLLLNNKGLRLPSLLEIDVYHQTGQYIFPVMPYVHVEYYCHIVLAMLSNLARPIKTGTLNMRMFQNKDIRGAFDELMKSFRDVAEALAHCINNPKVTPWEDVEHAIESSHDHWIEFLRAGQQAMKMGGNADESFAVKSISIFLYNTGTRLRELYFATAVAMCKEDSNALRLTFIRLKKRPSWLLSRTAYENIDTDPLELIESQRQGEAPFLDDSISLKETEKSIRKIQWNKNVRSVLSSEFGVRQTSANMTAHRMMKIPLWVITGLQYFVTVFIAVVLNTIPAVQSKVFNNRGADVVFTVVVMWQPNIGSLTSRAFNRAVGTGMAAVWSYVLLGITYGVTGTTWDSSPQKWIIAGFLGALWGAFCVLNAARFKVYSYMWFVAGFTVALVCLSLMREPTPPWGAAGERLLNVIYGIVISWAVALVLFPISAWRVVRDNYSRSCTALSAAVASLPDLFEPVEDVSNIEHIKERIFVTPLNKLENIHGIGALYEPLNNPKLANSLHLTNRARRLVSNTMPFIGLAEKEVFYFRRPKRIPKGRIGLSAHTSNLFIDYLIQILSLKTEFFPHSDWKVTESFHQALRESFKSLARTLGYLDVSIHKQGKGIDAVISSLQESATQVENLSTVAKTILDNFQKLSEKKQDKRAPLQNAEILIVYLSFSMYLQTKCVILAASKAFMFTHPEAMALVEKHVGEEDFLSLAHRGPENIISELMEGSMLSPFMGQSTRSDGMSDQSNVYGKSDSSGSRNASMAVRLKDELDRMTMRLSSDESV
ncbi:hypothetical protein M9435_005180 [Picochlorum sp. BPE23]|nr:hypothetical protein M9435_005180 [Picochlorum sp. BPE23]